MRDHSRLRFAARHRRFAASAVRLFSVACRLSPFALLLALWLPPCRTFRRALARDPRAEVHAPRGRLGDSRRATHRPRAGGGGWRRLPFPSREIWDRFHVDAAEIQRRGALVAAADLATLKPRYERNRKQVIQYAELTSDRPIVASAVLAPKFLDLFRDTLGDKVLLVVPNRFTAYVFPALASNYQDYYPMVFEAYHDTAWPISVEVFEVSAAGMRAVGFIRAVRKKLFSIQCAVRESMSRST